LPRRTPAEPHACQVPGLICIPKELLASAAMSSACCKRASPVEYPLDVAPLPLVNGAGCPLLRQAVAGPDASRPRHARNISSVVLAPSSTLILEPMSLQPAARLTRGSASRHRRTCSADKWLCAAYGPAAAAAQLERPSGEGDRLMPSTQCRSSGSNEQRRAPGAGAATEPPFSREEPQDATGSCWMWGLKT